MLVFTELNVIADAVIADGKTKVQTESPEFTPIDARYFFDCYLVRYSSWREIAEVLQYTHVWDERCIGRIMSKAQSPGIQRNNRVSTE